jgi:hypothetical protein
MSRETVSDETMNKKTVFVSGYAKLPGKIPSNVVYGSVGVFLVVNTTDGIILDADFSLISRTSKELLWTIFVGKCVDKDRQSILSELSQRYLGYAQKALIAATNNLFERYDELVPKTFFKNELNSF